MKGKINLYGNPFEVLNLFQITLKHFAAPELCDARKLFPCPSVKSHQEELVPSALPQVALTYVLVIAVWVPVWMHSRFAAGSPLNTLKVATRSSMKPAKKEPRRACGPTLSVQQNKQLKGSWETNQ